MLALGLPATVAQAQTRRLPVPLRDIESTARPDSLDPDARVALGRVYWDRGKHSQAEAELLAALALDPRHAEGNLAAGIHPFARESRYLVDLRGRLGLDSAVAFLRGRARMVWDAFTYDPLVDLTILYPARDEVIASWWDKPLRKAVGLVFEGRDQQSFAILDQEIRTREPGRDQEFSNDFLFYFGLVALRAGHPDRAADAFAALGERMEALERSPDVLVPPNRRPYYEFLKADALARAGRRNDAAAALRRVLELDMGHVLAHSRLADLDEATGDLDGALAHRRAAIDLMDRDPGLRLDLAATLMAKGEAAAAARAAGEALDLDPRRPGSWYLRARAAELAGDSAAARDAYARFVEIAPSAMAAQRDSAHLRLAQQH